MDASSFALATSLSAAAGIRPFLTIAIAAWMMYSGQLHPSEQFQWLGSAGVATLLSVLAVIEFGADKIPLLDHALHALHFAAKPVVAALIVGGTMPGTDAPAETYATMGIGALSALGIHTSVTAVRAASTTYSFALANPVISIVEDVVAAAAIVVAFLAPFVALAITIFALVVLVRLARSLRRSVTKPVVAG